MNQHVSTGPLLLTASGKTKATITDEDVGTEAVGFKPWYTDSESMGAVGRNYSVNLP